MANTTITNLPTVTSLNGTEPLLGVQSSNSVQITTGQIATYAGTTFGLQPISPTYMLANVTGSSAIPTGVSVTSFLDNSVSNVQGAIMYRSATLWTALPPGISGQVLSTQGSAANPIWRSTPGTGTVTSITAGTNLSATPANPITASGTINVIDNPTFVTSVTTPSIYGGSSVSQTLLLQSTTGVGTSDNIVFKTGNNGANTALTMATTGASTFGVSATSPLFLATASRTATATTGAYSYGTNGFSDTSVLLSLQSSVNSYNQATIQNTSAGTSASAEFIAYNDGGTASTNYASVGINSSGYTGTGSLNAAGYGFFTTGSTDLVLGTIGSNAIHFVTNSSATDAMSISAAGVVSIPSASITSLTTPLVIGGTTASSTLTLQSTSGVGTSDSVSIKVGNNGATTGLTVATTGIASFPTTGATGMVVGTTAQRPTAATGYFRFNTSLPRFEGYDGTSWTPVAITVGGGNDIIFTLNSQTVTTNYTVPTNTNAMSSGPIVINTGITVTIPTGSQWNII